MRLEGARCLVTGCSSGIGRATALAMAERGVTVIATARSLDSIEALRGPNLETLRLDVTDAAGAQAAVAASQPLDILVNNAGYGLEGAVEEVGDEELRRQYETNVFGPWRLCRAVLPGMRARGSGAIVNVSSVGGQVPFPGLGAYRSSKFAMEGLSWTLHFEVSHFGIRVLDVQPGLVASDFDSRSLKVAEAATPESPYEPMRRAAEAVYPRMSPVATAPEVVAAAIVAELEKDRGPLRLRVGSDAERVLGAAAAGDEGYERFLVDQLGFSWHPAPPAERP